MKLKDDSSYNEFIVALFTEHGKLKNYKRKTRLFSEEENPLKCYFIEKGLVKVSQSTAEGHNITVFLRNKKELFGMIEIILEIPRNRFAECLTDCKLWEIDNNKFLNLIRQNQTMNNSLLKMVSSRLLLMQQNVVMLSSKPVPWRLAWLLKKMSEENSSFIIDNILTQEEISNVIGCSRQTISETLNHWHKKKYINYEKRTIHLLNIEKLLKND